MDIEGTLAIIFMFGTPVILGVVIAVTVTFNNMRKQGERERGRETFERLTREKLDVIRTAIAMGRSDDEILDLDKRLEALIGTKQMLGLLDQKAPQTPVASSQIQDADLIAEVDRLQSKAKDTE